MRIAVSVGVVALACFLMAAHVLRAGLLLLALGCAFLPFLMLVRRPWAPVVIQLALLIAAAEWLRTIARLMRERIAAGEPWIRMVVILGAVTALTLGAAGALRHPAIRRGYPPS